MENKLIKNIRDVRKELYEIVLTQKNSKPLEKTNINSEKIKLIMESISEILPKIKTKKEIEERKKYLHTLEIKILKGLLCEYKNQINIKKRAIFIEEEERELERRKKAIMDLILEQYPPKILEENINNNLKKIGKDIYEIICHQEIIEGSKKKRKIIGGIVESISNILPEKKAREEMEKREEDLQKLKRTLENAKQKVLYHKKQKKENFPLEVKKAFIIETILKKYEKDKLEDNLNSRLEKTGKEIYNMLCQEENEKILGKIKVKTKAIKVIVDSISDILPKIRNKAKATIRKNYLETLIEIMKKEGKRAIERKSHKKRQEFLIEIQNKKRNRIW